MTNMSTNAPDMRPKRSSRSQEYAVYFALIFVVSLPGSILGWAFNLVRGKVEEGAGPFSAALRHARMITPQIFSV